MTSSTSNPAKLRTAKWHAIAEKIAADSALLEIPLAIIDRWLANGQDAPHMLEAWQSCQKNKFANHTQASIEWSAKA